MNKNQSNVEMLNNRSAGRDAWFVRLCTLVRAASSSVCVLLPLAPRSPKSGPSQELEQQMTRKAHPHVEKIQSMRHTQEPLKGLPERSHTLKCFEIAFDPAAKDTKRYEHVDALIKLLGDENGTSWRPESEMNSARPNMITSSSSYTWHGCLVDETQCFAWSPEDQSFHDPADLVTAHKMYCNTYAGVGLSAARKCRATAYTTWPEARTCTSKLLTTLASALEPVDYSSSILRNAPLQAGIVECVNQCGTKYCQ